MLQEGRSGYGIGDGKKEANVPHNSDIGQIFSILF
jgi:hypothetical protein